MLIRPAKPNDLQAIRSLIRSYPKQLIQDAVPASKNFFIAEDRGVTIGCCALEIYSPKIAEVRSLVVRKDFQGKGVGTKLIRACVARAKSHKVREILVITGVVGLFDRVGFKAFNKEKYALFKVLK